jgi:hypothetical protein
MFGGEQGDGFFKVSGRVYGSDILAQGFDKGCLFRIRVQDQNIFW